MTTAATSMTTMRRSEMDELRDGEVPTTFRRAPRSRAMRDTAGEMLSTSQMRLPWLIRSRRGACVTARVRPEGSAR
jgi:hypothetical protein